MPAGAQAVLEGRGNYNDATLADQSVVRREWERRIADGLAELDLAAEFAAQQRSWVELDDAGRILERPGPTSE